MTAWRVVKSLIKYGFALLGAAVVLRACVGLWQPPGPEYFEQAAAMEAVAKATRWADASFSSLVSGRQGGAALVSGVVTSGRAQKLFQVRVVRVCPRDQHACFRAEILYLRDER